MRASSQLRTDEYGMKLATPQCEAERMHSYYSDRWRTGPGRPQCKLSSAFQIEGRYYCKKHAGHVALCILLGSNSAEPAYDEWAETAPRYREAHGDAGYCFPSYIDTWRR